MIDKYKEIGGYFGLEVFSGLEYHHDLIAVNSGRNALLYILKARNVKKLYIPAFLCDSVSQLCIREGYAYEEYPIDANFLPVFDKELENGAYLYIVNYYGQISEQQLISMKERWTHIIFDNVQDFFRRPVPGIDTVYSCRKFFGVPDGGYVATDAIIQEPLPADGSKDRMSHILGRLEESASAYYKAFQDNDELFYSLPLREMSPLTKNILRGVNYDTVRSRRNNNFAKLHRELGTYNQLSLHIPDGPYCYPFYVENGMDIKRRLATKQIYVATLWPNVLEHGSQLEQDFAKNILPLPCDQRYDSAAMDTVIAEVLAAMA